MRSLLRPVRREPETAHWLELESVGGRYRPIRNEAVSAACDARLRLLCWNIHRGYQASRVAAELLRLTRALSPDLVLLQEVPIWTDGPFWEMDELRALFDEFNVAFAPMHRVSRPSPYYPFEESGLLLASRRPLTQVEVLELPTVTRPKLGRDHRIVRVALRGHIRTSVGPARIVNIHLENTTGPSGRSWQARWLAERLLDPEPVVLAGDVNTLWGRREGVSQAYAAAGLAEVDLATSSRAPRLDRIFSRGVEVVGAAMVPAGGSDHQPLAAEMRVIPGESYSR